jgi:hypothetical protein
MRFNPINKNIYTDEGIFIKKMNCPFQVDWNDLAPSNDNWRKCNHCDHVIIDTNALRDVELLAMVAQNPYTCIKIDLNQDNIKITSDGSFEQR